MKIIAVYFEDDSVDLSAFSPSSQVTVSTSTATVEGGKVLFLTSPLAQFPVPDHDHDVQGTTGPPK